MGKRGRPIGSKSFKTIQQQMVLDAVKDRIYKASAKLINSQLIAAEGTHKMVVKTKDSKSREVIRTIRDVEEMDKLLIKGVYGKDYFIVEGTLGDWRAGESLLHRAFGKPSETLDVTSQGKSIVVVPPELISKNDINTGTESDSKEHA